MIGFDWPIYIVLLEILIVQHKWLILLNDALILLSITSFIHILKTLFTIFMEMGTLKVPVSSVLYPFLDQLPRNLRMSIVYISMKEHNQRTIFKNTTTKQLIAQML